MADLPDTPTPVFPARASEIIPVDIVEENSAMNGELKRRCEDGVESSGTKGLDVVMSEVSKNLPLVGLGGLVLPYPMSTLSWNCRGLGSPRTIQ